MGKSAGAPTIACRPKDGVDMRLHESHDEEGFGVPNNTLSRHAAAYATNARFVAFLGTFARPAQEVWLPGNDLQDPATWSVPPLCTLKHLHAALLQDYDCTEQPAADLPARWRVQQKSTSVRRPSWTKTSPSWGLLRQLPAREAHRTRSRCPGCVGDSRDGSSTAGRAGGLQQQLH